MNNYIKIDDNCIIDILVEEYLGSGNHWDVWLVTLKKPYIVNNESYPEIVYKIPKTHGASIKQNIEEYTNICKADLPTLKFYFKGILVQSGNKSDIIIAENINSKEAMFVSPNSIKIQNPALDALRIAVSDNKLNELNKNMTIRCSTIKNNNDNLSINELISCIENHSKIDAPCIEKSLLENKISKIVNWDEFIISVFNDVKKAAIQGISIYEDAFFFGTDRKYPSRISYKIADFDSLLTVKLNNDDQETTDFIKGNHNHAHQAIYSFIQTFIIGCNKALYLKVLEKHYDQLVN